MRGKFYKKVLPFTLTFTFMLTMIPSNLIISAAKENKPKKQTKVVKELVEKRTENAKVFLNDDGTYTATVYQNPIHYKNGDKLEDIDNTLIKQEKTDKVGSFYKNKANKLHVILDENIDSETPISIELDKYKVDMKPITENTGQTKKLTEIKKNKTLDDGKVEEDSIASLQYENIYDDAGIKYTPTDSGLKEEIILNSYKQKNSFQFILTLKDLVPYPQESGSIILKDKQTNEEKGYIEKPFIYDSSQQEHFSDNVSITIEKIKDKNEDSAEYKLIVIADEKFLQDKNTVYPVIIDPTTVLQGAYNTYDTYVESAYPNSNFTTSTQLRAGYDSTTGKVRSYVVFATLPSIEGGIINSAVFNAYGTNSNVAAGNNAYINVHRVVDNWWGSSITWNNAAAFESNAIAQAAVSSPTWYSWDITSLVSGWYSGSIANYGFVMKDSAETTKYRRFDSNDGVNKPRLEINYSPALTTLNYGAYSSGANTGTGYVDLSWNSVIGAVGYKVAIFNGSFYEYIDVGNTTWWTTQGKGIWPYSFESYTLHLYGGGTELANDPAVNYGKSAGGYDNVHNYYFRILAYNAFGQQSDIGYNCVTPTLPDSTSPSTLPNPSILISYSPNVNQANTWQAKVNWSSSYDLPSALASGLNSYRIRLYKSGVYQREVSVAPSITSVTFDNLSDCSNYTATVQAIDNNGNSSTESSTQVGIQTGDRTRPNMPSSVTLDKSSWTNASSVIINWSNLYDNVGLATVQYSIDSSPWVDTGNTNPNSSYTIYTNSLSEGEHTISIRGIDAQGNDGYAASTKYYKDTTLPESALFYPLNQQTINGVINVKGTVGDAHFKDWRLEYGIGTNPSSYTIIASGTNAVNDALISGWNVSSLAENTYTLRIVASDAAGNSRISSVQVVKSNSISYSPTIQIDSPTSGSLVTTITKDVIYQRINSGGSGGLKGKLFINSILVDEELVPGEGLSFNSLNYSEGSLNSMYIEAVDADGNKLYSTTMYTSPDGITSFANSTHMFTVKLMDEPKNLTATPNINYTTLLRWDYDTSKIVLDGITFSVYRGITENFVPNQSNLIAEGLTSFYWNDYNLNYGEKFYYKVTARKSINGVSRESVPSNVCNATVVAKDELEKRLGLESYWGFSQFRTGSGEGYINLSSGNLSYQTVDFVFPGSKLVQAMRRSYNSQSTTKTPLGYGFDFSFNTNLLKEYDVSGSETGIILKDGDGSIHRFTKNTDGSYSAAKVVYMTLSFNNSDGSYKIKRKDNIEYLFDKSMRLSRFTEPNGNFLELSYNTRGNLAQIEDNYQNITTLEYDTKDRLVTAKDPSGRIFNYIYDDSTDRLKKMYTLLEYNVEYSEEFVYDSAAGKIITIIDPKKNITELAYTNEKLTEVTDPINEFYTISYESLKTIITSYRGKSVAFDYNDNGNVTKKTDPLGNSINYEVDDNYNVTRMYYTNNVGGVNKELNYYYNYDSNGNLLTIKDPLNNVSEYKNYNSFNEVGQIINPISTANFAITEYTYDDKGNIRTVKDAEGRLNSSTYDSNGNLISVTDSFGNITSYSYDSKGRLIKITEPQGIITEVLAFDSQNNPIKVKDSMGRIVEVTYDLMGRERKVTYPDGKYTESYYDLNSNLTEFTDRLNYTTYYGYDALDRATSITDAAGKTHTISYGYGTDNNVIVTYKDAEGRTNKTYYDAAGRVIKEEGSGTFVTYEYDQAGNMVSTKDAEGRESKFVYNELNQGISLIADSQGEKVTQEFTYDLMGNKISTKDGEGNIVSYQLDKIGRLKKVVNTAGGEEITTSYQYDLREGGLVYNKNIDALGRESLSYFDSLGRKVKDVREGTTGDSERQVTSYEYNLDGTVKKITKPNGNRVSMVDVKDGTPIETSYAFDRLSRIIQYVQEGHALNYEYDGSGNRTKVYYTEGNSTKNIEYNYDMLNRLQSISLNGKTVRDYSYTPSGKVDYINNYRKFDTGESDFVRVKYSYNSLGLPTNISYLDNNSVKKEEYALSFDKRGYIKNETAYTNYDTESTVNKTYNYDEIGRLLSVINTTDNKTTSYTYDKVGNRLTMEEGSDSFAYSYNQFNSLLEIKKNGAVDSTFSYDANGNQTEEIAGSKTTTFGYDKADRLINLTIKDGSNTSSITNVYNGDGQRIKQIENGAATKYYYDGDSLLFTADINNIKGQEHILDPQGTVIASKRFDGNYSNKYFFYNYDIRGSVTNIINPEGTLVKGYNYNEFGSTKETGDALFKNDIKFTGAVHDTSANIYYMNSRFYNPNTGRFLTQDSYTGNPYDPWTQHLYSYTSNNPVNFIDPTGHMMLASADDAAGSSVDSTSGKMVPIVDIYQSSKYFVSSNNTNNAVIRGMTTEEKVKSWVSKGLPFVPVVNVVNNANIAITGSDLTGHVYFDDEIQDARLFFTVVVLSIALTGLISLPFEGAGEAKNVFPKNPADMLPDVPSKTTPKGNIKWEPNQNTRIQYHPGEPVAPGETFNSRHHDPHYHVEIRNDVTKGWNNPGNTTKVTPPGYKTGSGTGFLPGEKFPGSHR